MTVRASIIRRATQYAAGLGIFLIIWWGGSLLAGPTLLPGPAAVARRLAEAELYARFLPAIFLTLSRALGGFALAWIISFPLGLLMGAKPAAGRLGFFPVFLFQGAPPLLWITPLVLWLGTNGAAAPAVAFLVTTPLLTSHVYEARRLIPEQAHHMFRIYNPARAVLWKELYLPRLLPAVKVNIHLGIMTAVKSAMLAEWFAAQNGFGRYINTYYQFFDLESFFTWALLFLLSMALLSLAIRHTVERLFPSRAPATAETNGSSPRRGRLPAGDGSKRYPEPESSTPAEGAKIAVSKLSMGFDGSPIFSGIDLTVDAEKPLIISGPSGCGKTTLLKGIVGLFSPMGGRVDAPKRTVLLFQEDLLLDHRDALGNVLLPVFPGWNTGEVERARKILSLWGLEGWEGHYPHELSGGMRKRLAMARAWFYGADALLMDEPFINLDREARQALWQRFFDLHAESPVPTIIITHYPEELENAPGRLIHWEQLIRPS